jgi:hypothetical protein
MTPVCLISLIAFGLPLSYNGALALWLGFRRSRPGSAMPR